MVRTFSSAIETVGKLAIDKDGAPPLTGSTAYQMRSVAVPFGNCIEPSNVKAGGKACPHPLPMRRLRLLSP